MGPSNYLQLGVPQNKGYLFRGPYDKGYSILGSILGPPYSGKLATGLIKLLRILLTGRMSVTPRIRCSRRPVISNY